MCRLQWQVRVLATLDRNLVALRAPSERCEATCLDGDCSTSRVMIGANTVRRTRCNLVSVRLTLSGVSWTAAAVT